MRRLTPRHKLKDNDRPGQREAGLREAVLNFNQVICVGACMASVRRYVGVQEIFALRVSDSELRIVADGSSDPEAMI